MSAPSAVAVAAAAILLGLPVVAAAAHLEGKHRAAVTADAAALAAADALTGWADGEPCALAAEVAAAAQADLRECEVNQGTGEARVRVTAGSAPVRAEAGARAGPLPPPNAGVSPGAEGWVWPAAVRAVSQGLHDGFAIDLAVPAGAQLLAPARGVVVFAGADGAGLPEACRVNPEWWRGPNFTVIVRHDRPDGVVFSSHNHVAPGSSAGLGIFPGVAVAAGQPLAAAGMSGCTSGPHSHFTLATTPSNAFPDLNPFDVLGTP
ncbi:putative peptidase (putative secreted protein) [Leucobacter sp. 7(1)]|uniref:peptidoglycan DD-metalloendopeptidase family protein n=1 Tax=Leucobacter sp. 7(1) TaxID=1255613 RepID=UPI00097E7E9B|nr:peptidoglycan DD-metalloendopeptidase family protein [Leucobacter sp. 7(1)]SJN11325.1 putative peptidase (putative secreted protein) [Leucobacter sp. 7(1)]